MAGPVLGGKARRLDLDERAEMYRTLLNSRRMPIVLDDGTAETQIVPLLPGSGRCAVIVRASLRLTYDALPPHAARLFRLLGLVAAESLPMWSRRGAARRRHRPVDRRARTAR